MHDLPANLIRASNLDGKKVEKRTKFEAGLVRCLELWNNRI